MLHWLYILVYLFKDHQHMLILSVTSGTSCKYIVVKRESLHCMDPLGLQVILKGEGYKFVLFQDSICNSY